MVTVWVLLGGRSCCSACTSPAPSGPRGRSSATASPRHAISSPHRHSSGHPYQSPAGAALPSGKTRTKKEGGGARQIEEDKEGGAEEERGAEERTRKVEN